MRTQIILLMTLLLVFVLVQMMSIGNSHFSKPNLFKNIRRSLVEFPFICSFFSALAICPSDIDKCIEVKPLSEDEFDIAKFTEKSWYVQKQQENPYQDLNALYCVLATYDLRDDGNFEVTNFRNIGGVNMGDGSVPSNEEQQCGVVIKGGEILLNPCISFFDHYFYKLLDIGPYWVIAVDEEYEWAVISGGAPDRIVSEDPLRCKTTNGETNLDAFQGSGLWIVSHESSLGAENVTAVMTMLDEMGIYTGDLIDVVHDECRYENAYIK